MSEVCPARHAEHTIQQHGVCSPTRVHIFNDVEFDCGMSMGVTSSCMHCLLSVRGDKLGYARGRPGASTQMHVPRTAALWVHDRESVCRNTDSRSCTQASTLAACNFPHLERWLPMRVGRRDCKGLGALPLHHGNRHTSIGFHDIHCSWREMSLDLPKLFRSWVQTATVS